MTEKDSTTLLSAEEVLGEIKRNGLGYCIQFINVDRIEDDNLRALWSKVHDSGQNVINYLEEKENESWRKGLSFSTAQL